MNLVIGILLFALGLIALFAWWGDLLPFLKGVLVLSLLLWGAVAIIVGAAKRRAKTQYDRSKNDAASTAENAVSEA